MITVNMLIEDLYCIKEKPEQNICVYKMISKRALKKQNRKKKQKGFIKCCKIIKICSFSFFRQFNT